MKKCLKFLFITGLAFLVFGCDDDDKHVAEPIPPIFKEVKMPSEMSIIPGQATQTVSYTHLKSSKFKK